MRVSLFLSLSLSLALSLLLSYTSLSNTHTHTLVDQMLRKWKGAKIKNPLLMCSTLMIPRCGSFSDLHSSDNEGEQLEQDTKVVEEDDELVEFNAYYHNNHDKNNTILSSPLLRSPLSSPLKTTSAFNLKQTAPMTPRGYLAMYVGEEKRRFLVKTHILNHPLFSVLLEKAKEEFGFEQKGGLSIACEVVLFEHLLWMMENKHLDYLRQVDGSSLIDRDAELCELLDCYHMSNSHRNGQP